MKLRDLRLLVKKLDNSLITVFEYTSGQERWHLHFRRTVAPDSSPGTPLAPRMGSRWYLRAPAVGLFFLTHPLGEMKEISEGESVSAGQLVAFLRVNDILLPVVTHRAGILVRRVATAGARIGYGDVLFELS